MTQTFRASKLRVAVLMGGRSIEREVSFNSGRTICDHLDVSLYEVTALYQTAQGKLYILPWHFLHRGKTADFEDRLTQEATPISWDGLKDCVDFVYTALHGKYAEDGVLQGMLSVLGIPFLGADIFSGAVCMNKSIHRDILSAAGITIAPGLTITAEQITLLVADSSYEASLIKQIDQKNLSFPLVVKPVGEGSSLGVSVVFSKSNLAAALLGAATCDAREVQDVVLEEKIEGMEFVCIALQQKDGSWQVLPVTEVVHAQGTHFLDYKQKYMPGFASKITPARISQKQSEKIQQTCLRATKALGLSTIARIDGFLAKNDEVFLIDSQPITGMAPSTFLFNQAAEINMSHTQLINHLIEVDLYRAGYGGYGMQKNRNEGTAAQVVNEPKLKVAVLLGGDSREREISLESGRNVCYKLFPNKYEVTPVFVTEEMELYALSQRELVKNTTSAIVSLLTPENKIEWSALPTRFDFAFIALHGGKGENGAVQGALEMLDVPYNGSGVFASSLCMNKYKTNQLLKQKGIDVPTSLLISKEEWSLHADEIIKKIASTFSLPCIVKPHDDGCSMLVYKIKSHKQIEIVLNEFFATEKSIAMVEEFVVGIELTVGVIGNQKPRALPASQPIVKEDILSIEEKFLPGAGENQTPALISAKAMELVQKTMEEAYRAIGCSGYARIDCFYQEASISPTGSNRVVILEINSLPGLTPATCIFHQAAEVGIRPMEFIDSIISLGIERFKSRRLDLFAQKNKKELHEGALPE